MKVVLTSLLFLCTVVTMQAQRITREYNNVSISEALRELNEQSDDYIISFLYNELEDFHITTSIHRKTVPDAIQQMIGFYPIRMTVEDKEIIVECPQKTAPRYKGTIVDEQDLPVSYATIALLSPQDSTLLAGGVSNESGLFVIPCEQQPVLARISFVGYKTMYRLLDARNVGTIRIQQESITINGVQVKDERIVVKAENGHLTYHMPQLLEILPADNAYEALTRISGVVDTGDGMTFAGQPVTLIINGKVTTLDANDVVERLKQMPASMVAKAEVMASAPPKYHVKGMAINVVTKDFAGTNQFAGQLQGFFRQNKYQYGQAKSTVIYQHGNLGIDASYAYGYGDAYGKAEHIAHHPLGNQRVDYADRTEHKNRVINHNYRIGMDYAVSEESRLSVAYTGKWTSSNAVNTSTGLETSVQHSKVHDYLHNVDASYSAPFGLELSASYTNYQNPRTQHLDGQLYDQSRNLLGDSRQRISKWLFTADQTHVLPHDWELNYGVEAQVTRNESYQTTRTPDGQPVPDATSHVDYTERIFDFYVGFNKQITPSLSVDASLGAEQYHAPKWNEWRIYPTFNAMWNVSDKSMLNLSFSSHNVFPTYWSTMSNIFYTSAYSEIWGNPDLKPQPTYNINLIWQYRQRYTFTAFATYMPDYFVQLAYQPSDRMAVIMKETNFDFQNIHGLQASVRFGVGKWLNGTINATGIYRHDKSNKFFDLPFDRTKLTAILSTTTMLRLTQLHDIRLTLNPSFQSKAIQGIYDIDPYFRLHASLRWTSDNGKWSAIIAGNNILNNHINVYSRLANQDYSMHMWNEYPNVSLTAIYRIGGFKEKKKKEVDISRMGY